jgi:RNA polymerase-binding transcription factor DksA
MAIQKKKATPVEQKSKSKKAASKPVPAKKPATKAAPVKKAAAKKAPVKKVAPKKVAATKATAKKAAPVTKSKTAKKAAPQKTAAVKKVVAKKAAPAKKAASKLIPSKKITKPIKNKTAPVKKAASVNTKKATPKKLTSVKKASEKKPTTLVKKNTSQAADKKQKVMAKAVKEKKVDKEIEPKTIIDHKAELKKALSKVKAKNKENQKAEKKPFVMPKTNTEKARKYEPEFVKSVLDQSPEEYSGPTMRYSDNELVEFRELISRKLETAKKELGYLQGLITRKDQMGGDESDNRYMTMEDGSLSMEREQLSQMASRQITFIDHLEKAMMRIENKTYGICRVTGKLIDKARLRAVPHATLSIEAKMGITR